MVVQFARMQRWVGFGYVGSDPETRRQFTIRGIIKLGIAVVVLRSVH